ncbi:MAG TPA: hypothetical protein VFF73_04885 [Planctomycetota bacterium]|nr:hypothetical protein [Planctomycetota bacterium]
MTPGNPALGLELIPGNAASQYDLYVPSTYNGSPMGIVLAFHGVEGTSTPDSWFEVCVYYCNNDRFIIVAPRGDVNDGGSGAWTQPYGRDVLDYVRSKYNVDDKRHYLAAISGGALPGIWMALASGPATYTTQYGGYTVKSGYQSDFAAVGFCSAEYKPSDPDFATMQSETAAQLGFNPALWTDYGGLSPDQVYSDELAGWAQARNYAPVHEVVRPGEGHPPNPPFSYEVQMFDIFAATKKP